MPRPRHQQGVSNRGGGTPPFGKMVWTQYRLGSGRSTEHILRAAATAPPWCARAASGCSPELAHVRHFFAKASTPLNNTAKTAINQRASDACMVSEILSARRTFLSSFVPIRQHFALNRHLLRASLYCKQLAARFDARHRFTEIIRSPSAF